MLSLVSSSPFSAWGGGACWGRVRNCLKRFSSFQLLRWTPLDLRRPGTSEEAACLFSPIEQARRSPRLSCCSGRICYTKVRFCKLPWYWIGIWEERGRLRFSVVQASCGGLGRWKARRLSCAVLALLLFLISSIFLVCGLFLSRLGVLFLENWLVHVLFLRLLGCHAHRRLRCFKTVLMITQIIILIDHHLGQLMV